jgi:hypothetical protein
MGAATAYYLSQLGVAATVVEREAVAAAASGTLTYIQPLDTLFAEAAHLFKQSTHILDDQQCCRCLRPARGVTA